MASLSYSTLQGRRQELRARLGQSHDAPTGSYLTPQRSSASRASLARSNAKLAIGMRVVQPKCEFCRRVEAFCFWRRA